MIGDLLEFYKNPNPAPWTVYDHSTQLAGATIAAAPAVFSEGPGTALHLYAPGPAGHFLEFYKAPNPASWQVFDHTPNLGNVALGACTPAIYSEGPAATLHVYAVRADWHLLEFYKDPNPAPWQLNDLTQAVGGDATVGDGPVFYSDGPGTALHLFVKGLNSHLLEFYKAPDPATWQVYDHTAEVGGTAIGASPSVYSEGPGKPFHAFTQGVNSHFLDFVKVDATTPWQVSDITAQAGGYPPINGAPALYPDTAANVLHAFAWGGPGDLLDFRLTSTGVFQQVVDITLQTSPSTASIWSPPTLFSEGPGTALHLFAASSPHHHLLEFYQPDTASPWQLYDHTADVGGNTTIQYQPATYWEGPGTALHIYDRFGPPPIVVTSPATAIGVTTATLNGVISAYGPQASYHFEYGQSANYGINSPDPDAVMTKAGGAVAQSISGLLPNTGYHFRLVATAAGGTFPGIDLQFTTLQQSGPPPPHGYSSVTVYNGLDSEGQMALWSFDENTNGPWDQVGTAYYQQSVTFRPPTDTHEYQLGAIDLSVNEDDNPNNNEFVWLLPAFECDPQGPAYPLQTAQGE